MKIVTVGVSPYIVTSNGKIHSKILKQLLLDGHSVSSLVWSHDTSFFFPEEHEGKKQFYYKSTASNYDVKVPIFPFHRGDRESVFVYEALNKLQPDIVVTVGDVTDFLFMHAVKMFYTSELKWLMVCAGRSLPIHGDHEDVVVDMDGVLCTNHLCYDAIQKIFPKPLCELSYIGVDTAQFQLNDQNESASDKFRIMTVAKNVQIDNAPMIMKAVADLRQEIPNVELYIHTNILDTGDYDLINIKHRFDPEDEFIKFPKKCVSYVEGISDSDLAAELNASDIFISGHMTAATSCSVWESLACGCYPLLSDCGSNRDIANELESAGIIKREDILLSCIELITTGEVNLGICDPDQTKRKVLEAYDRIKKNKGYRRRFSVFTQKYNEANFLQKVSKMSVEVSKIKQTLCVETV